MAVRQWTKGMKGGTVGVERPGKGISYTLKAGPGLPWLNHSESPCGLCWYDSSRRETCGFGVIQITATSV